MEAKSFNPTQIILLFTHVQKMYAIKFMHKNVPLSTAPTSDGLWQHQDLVSIIEMTVFSLESCYSE